MPELQRISKLMGLKQICSRREAEHLLEQGWVFVNGERAGLGQKAYESDTIEILPAGLAWLGGKLTVLLNKPVGYVSGQAEDGHVNAVTLITPQNYYSSEKETPFLRIEGLAPAGRLDIDSRGLLILTQDGVLAKKIIGAESSVSKEYIVKVDQSISDEQKAKLEFGLSLDGQLLKRAKVGVLSDQLMNLTLVEGKKRQIRRMCELVGLKVIFLKRIRVGNLELGELEEGRWRLLLDSEKESLLKL
jgi:23S rRNA pseudouridine2604 synthase